MNLICFAAKMAFFRQTVAELEDGMLVTAPDEENNAT